MIECRIILVAKNPKLNPQNMPINGPFFAPLSDMRAPPAVDRAPWVHIAWRHPASDQPKPKKYFADRSEYICDQPQILSNMTPPKSDPYLGGGQEF